MSEEDILSQDEMNDLANKSNGDETSPKEELHDVGQVQPYDFKQPEHTKQSHFPTLQIINEKTALDLREKLEVMLQQKVEVTAQESHINRFGEFLHSLNIPIDIKKIYVPELKGSFLICFDEELIGSVIEGYFGAPEMAADNHEEANSKSDDESKSNDNSEESEDELEVILEKEEFTNAESRISQKLLKYVLESMQGGWNLLDNYSFKYEKTENNPRLINDLDHEELLININFEIKIRNKINVIRIGMPYKMLDKVKHKLRRVVQNIQEASDKKWLAKLYDKLQSVPMELVGELGRVVVPVNKLIELKVGDTLKIQKPENITLYVNKTPILTGQLGESNGQTAIQINNWIKPEMKKI
ncbi:MAG: FliM/FliN family flagellar motor switch protein [Gammaproteobacteria bacterium]|nr:FliM/FliN family flagellar motor switch protein [Gammaproteobacteria bacterium]